MDAKSRKLEKKRNSHLCQKLAHSKTNGVYVGVAELVDALGSKSKNGKEGVKIYIAHKGKLCDVSESFLW